MGSDDVKCNPKSKTAKGETLCVILMQLAYTRPVNSQWHLPPLRDVGFALPAELCFFFPVERPCIYLAREPVDFSPCLSIVDPVLGCLKAATNALDRKGQYLARRVCTHHYAQEFQPKK